MWRKEERRQGWKGREGKKRAETDSEKWRKLSSFQVYFLVQIIQNVPKWKLHINISLCLRVNLRLDDFLQENPLTLTSVQIKIKFILNLHSVPVVSGLPPPLLTSPTPVQHLLFTCLLQLRLITSLFTELHLKNYSFNKFTHVSAADLNI